DWLAHLYGDSDTKGYQVELDSSDQVYGLGWVYDNVMFPTGFDTIMDGGGHFMIKLNEAGNFLASHRLLVNQTTPGVVPCMAVNGAGNTYFTGLIKDSVDIDLGAGVQWLYASEGNDMLAYQLDTAGNLQWLKQWDSNDQTRGTSIQPDELGNVYITGNFRDSLDIDPGPGTQWLTTSNGQRGIFIQKLDTAGNLLWARSLQDSTGNINCLQISLGPNSNIHLLGKFRGVIDFDPGPGVFQMDGGTVDDMFLMKMSDQGGLIWAKALGENKVLTPRDMVIDGMGNVISLGLMNSNGVDFDPGPDTAALFFPTFIGSYPVNPNHTSFVLKLKEDGSFIWVKQFSGERLGGDQGWIAPAAIATDRCDHLYVTGTVFGGVYAIDRLAEIPSEYSESQDQPEYHNSQLFLFRLDNAGTVIWSENIGLSGEGNNEEGIDVKITSVGEIVTCFPFTRTITQIDLTIVHASDSVLKASVCPPFVVNGQSYTSSGTYSQVLTNAVGCDSFLTVNLVILPSQDTTIEITACGSYEFQGQMVSSNVSFIENLTNLDGCDSTIRTNITILDTLNLLVAQNYTILTTAAAGFSYQWLDCDQGYVPLPGQTSQQLQLQHVGFGNYAVVLSNDFCRDTSACVSFLFDVGLDGSFPTAWQLFPNP
ncbi:unnamed protein product, partial [Ectocarpus sp. 12 AP-2014]